MDTRKITDVCVCVWWEVGFCLIGMSEQIELPPED